MAVAFAGATGAVGRRGVDPCGADSSGGRFFDQREIAEKTTRLADAQMEEGDRVEVRRPDLDVLMALRACPSAMELLRKLIMGGLAAGAVAPDAARA